MCFACSWPFCSCSRVCSRVFWRHYITMSLPLPQSTLPEWLRPFLDFSTMPPKQATTHGTYLNRKQSDEKSALAEVQNSNRISISYILEAFQVAHPSLGGQQQPQQRNSLHSFWQRAMLRSIPRCFRVKHV